MHIPSTLLALAAIAATASAQVAPPTPPTTLSVRLPQLIVTATGTSTARQDVPYSVEQIDEEAIKAWRLPRTLPEALRELPSVMLQKTAHGQGSPFIRGFTGYRTLLLVDGIRLNNSVFREGPNQYWNTVDAFSIGGLELVKGPGSVLYGSDAIGGTLNVLSPVRGHYGAAARMDGAVFWRGSSAENSQIAHARVNQQWDNGMVASLGFTTKRFGNLRSADSPDRQPTTGYDERAGDFALEYHLSPEARLVAAYQFSRQDDVWRTHRTVYGRSWSGTTIGTDLKLATDQSRDLGYIQYHQTSTGRAIEAMRLSVSFQRMAEFEERLRSNRQTNLQGVEVGTIGLSAQFQSPSSIGTWIYGVEHYRDAVDSFRRNYRADGSLESTAIQGPVGDEATYRQSGIYLQDTIEAGPRTEFVLGVRHTQAAAQAARVQHPVTGAAFTVADDWRATVGSARFLRKFGERANWRAFGGISQGFRAPNLSDLTRLDIARSGELELPSPDLQPERFTSFEVGLSADFARGRAQVAVFHTRISDLIDRLAADNPATPTVFEVIKANLGQGYVRGLEVAAEIKVHPQWTLHGNFTLMKGEVETMVANSPTVFALRPLSRVMPATANLGWRWRSTDQKFWSEISLTSTVKQDKLSPGDASDTQRIPPGGTPGYTVWHARGGWKVSPTLSLTAAIENVTDQAYRIHGSGLNEPGRNVVVGVDFRF
ncbi:MAG: TonB-dependent receptor [Candidatus Didemnitutus sp.]|nr:TonB-dependent receptor [Candidatus Didemnitutus sp.]